VFVDDDDGIAQVVEHGRKAGGALGDPRLELGVELSQRFLGGLLARDVEDRTEDRPIDGLGLIMHPDDAAIPPHQPVLADPSAPFAQGGLVIGEHARAVLLM
jgi:hypothetical protein